MGMGKGDIDWCVPVDLCRVETRRSGIIMNEVNAKSLESQREWLDCFYREMYLQIGFGPRQNEYYMEQILQRLNSRVKDYLARQCATLIDVGCAMGFGTIKLARTFPSVQTYGLEVNRHAVENGARLFPAIDFRYEENGQLQNHYDVIVSSHCLEHYLDPLDMLLELLVKANRYCIILAPYMEYPLGKSHLSVITDSHFPQQVTVGGITCRLIQKTIFAGDPNYSRTVNILAVYERAEEQQKGEVRISHGDSITTQGR